MNKHKIDYSAYPEIKWLNPYEALYYQEKRDALLAPFHESALFKGTKPFLKGISKGCELCGQGLWSCLFIASKCNATCFYCPTAQNSNDVPESQGLTFETAASYAGYINYFGFKGVGFSGGEPLLVAEKVLAYTTELRKTCNSDLYIWMYTNGLLASKKIFSQLGKAGINEVRFDIGATDYNLDAIEKARGYIQNLTIEIPAVPEETELLKKLLPQMVDAGITNLNLHQIRLTPYNVKKLATRNYTYIAAEQPIVLESELAALEIMNYAREKSIPIGINYCSFFFKNRFQKAGYFKRIATSLGINEAEISEKGFIRNLNANELTYDGIRLSDNGNQQGELKPLILNHKCYNYQRSNAFHVKLSGKEYSEILPEIANCIPISQVAFDIWMHEFIEKGLREY